LQTGDRIAIALALVLCSCLFSGCFGDNHDGQVLGWSLVEIGEQSLDQAEILEKQKRLAEANILYRRALWAFRYHERLTGEQPFLLDDSLAGVRRTAPAKR
jgi:hypothetical protein